MDVLYSDEQNITILETLTVVNINTVSRVGTADTLEADAGSVIAAIVRRLSRPLVVPHTIAIVVVRAGLSNIGGGSTIVVRRLSRPLVKTTVSISTISPVGREALGAPVGVADGTTEVVSSGGSISKGSLSLPLVDTMTITTIVSSVSRETLRAPVGVADGTTGMVSSGGSVPKKGSLSCDTAGNSENLRNKR